MCVCVCVCVSTVCVCVCVSVCECVCIERVARPLGYLGGVKKHQINKKIIIKKWK